MLRRVLRESELRGLRESATDDGRRGLSVEIPVQTLDGGAIAHLLPHAEPRGDGERFVGLEEREVTA